MGAHCPSTQRRPAPRSNSRRRRASAASAGSEPATAAQPKRKAKLVYPGLIIPFWLLVLCFAGAWLTAESERQRLLHVSLGYSMIGLVAFRLLWGFIGSRYARFAQFVRGPRAVGRYISDAIRSTPAGSPGTMASVALCNIWRSSPRWNTPATLGTVPDP